MLAPKVLRAAADALVITGALAAVALMTSCRIAPLQAVGTPDVLVDPPEEPVIPPPDPAAAWVPQGFRVEIAVKDLTYPTSIEFDSLGNMFVAESGYVYGDEAAPARIYQVSPDGDVRILAEQLSGPVTDLLWFNDSLYISHRGKISVLLSAGEVRDLVTGLPSLGDHHNNQLAAGPGGWIYFGQGTATNSGVVGVDNFIFGWLQARPDVHDIPARDIRIRNRVFTTLNPLVLAQEGEPPLTNTAAFSRFGQGVESLDIRGSIKANGTILRMRPNGTQLEVYAWGLRNPFGAAWGPGSQGPQLYVADNGADERGSRPVANAPEVLWAVVQDGWYGWPDYIAGVPITDRRFKPEGRAGAEFLMAEHPPVERPFITFDKAHGALTKLALSPGGPFGSSEHMFVAQFGDMKPVTSSSLDPVGRRVVRVNLRTRQIEPFFHARAEALGPVLREHVETPGPKRPMDIVFSPRGDAMYVVDLGAIMALPTAAPTVRPFPATGVVWRIVPEGAAPQRGPTSVSVIPPRAGPAR